MDGTLYLGNRLFDFTNELLSTIRENGADYLFMTNNSSKSVVDYIKKLDRLGIKAEYDDFITSSQATLYYLEKNHKNAPRQKPRGADFYTIRYLFRVVVARF